MSMRAEVLSGILAGLTEQPRKRSLYAVDTYFRESLEDIYSLGEEFARWFCERHALLLVKPDAVVVRKLRAVLDWVTDRGFLVVAVAPVAMGRPGELRHDLGSLNYQLNLVHAADDPADLVRELAVLYDHPTRMSLLRRVATGVDATREANEAIQRLEVENPSVSIDLAKVLDEI